MREYEQVDELLKQALSPKAIPDEKLNKKIIEQLKERNIMRPIYKHKIASILIIVTLTFAMSVSAFAAWHLLNPKEVAQKVGNDALAKAFEDKDALEINQSIISGEYNFTFLGIVSGEGLSEFESSVPSIYPDRTYAVVSIAKKDGSEMPSSTDEDYDKIPFFVSPLIKGQKPWQVNIASMNGGYEEFVKDGIMYRLIECDGVELFADRGIYLCISTSSFYDINAFNYNEETGEVSINENYDGANALFDLPIEASKGNYEKAEKYLKNLLGEEENEEDSSIEDIEIDKNNEKIQLKEEN